MSTQRVQRSVDVERAVGDVYAQWTRFEEFPKFMFGVKSVHRLSRSHLRWTASVWGRDEEWVAEILELRPDARISWRSISGARSTGTVLFNALTESRTRVTLIIAYEPKGLVERLGNSLGFLDAQVQNAVDDFKLHMETGRAVVPPVRRPLAERRGA